MASSLDYDWEGSASWLATSLRLGFLLDRNGRRVENYRNAPTRPIIYGSFSGLGERGNWIGDVDADTESR